MPAQRHGEAGAIIAAKFEPAVGFVLQAVVDVDGGEFDVQTACQPREQVQQDDGVEAAAERGFDVARMAQAIGQGLGGKVV